MKRRKKSLKRKQKNSARHSEKISQTLNYDPLEQRQVLVADIGFSAIGATLGEAGITSQLPNAEGDVSATHYVEVGQQTFTVYLRDGGNDATVVKETSLNQFFEDAGANLFGDSLQGPRVIYDRAIDRWFLIATGDGEGDFAAGNRVHLAFSQTSDPSGQWQQLDFVADFSGQLRHSNVSLGVDADGVYFATQNFDDENEFVDISIYSVPKSDLLIPNPTLENITFFNNLSIFEYGRQVQFASNFEASDNSILLLSSKSVDLNEGTGLPPNERLTPGTLNAFQIVDGGTPNAMLTTPVEVDVDSGEAEGPFVEPDRMFQPSADGTFGIELEQLGGLTAGLIEADGSVFGAQTVGFEFDPDADMPIDTRSNGINWFELDVSGAVPVAQQTQVILDRTFFIDPAFNVDFIPDPPGMETVEQGAINYFNPSIAISDSGLVALTFNGTINAEAAQFNILDAEGLVTPQSGAPFDLTQFRIHTYAAVGLRVQGTQPVGTIQLEGQQLLYRSFADGPFNQAPEPDNLWGRYSTVRPDPGSVNSLFSVIPYQSNTSNDRWTVAVTEILPVQLNPVIPGSADGDLIVVSLDETDTDFVEVSFDGVITDRFESSLINRITINGGDGNDTFIVDYTNGDPTPVGGFIFNGGGGSDSLETLTDDNVDFQILDQGLFFSQFTVVTSNGVDIPINEQITHLFTGFETLIGGGGDDSFTFVNGVFPGDVNGQDGNDRFIFSGGVRTGGSVNGGTGFNTLDLTDRIEPTGIVLFSVGFNEGFNGRTLDGPIGEFNSVLDQFRDISLVRGSTLNDNDSMQALNQFVATYTLEIPDIDPFDGTPDSANSFVASTLEQNGSKLYFSNFDFLSGSVMDDVFNVRSNDGNALSFVQLDGRAGDDVFNFSSDSPTNLGVLANIGGLFEVNGGTGDNSLIVSDAGRLGEEEFLVLGARISGPVEVIFFSQDFATGDLGNFDVTIFGSNNTESDTFFLQSFLDQNTLNVFGLGGDDIFVIQDLSQAVVEIFGGEGDDDYIIEQVAGIDDRDVTIFDSVDAENDQAIIAGTILDEVFIVDLNSFVSENFTFNGVEEFGFDGRGGNDEFYVRSIDAAFPVILRGGGGDDRFYISSDSPINFGDLDDLNNNLTIEDDLGVNQIFISNEAGNAIDVEVFEDQIVGLFNGVLNYSGLFDLIEIIGSNGGDDRFVITSFLVSNSLRIDGRLGEDEFVIGNQNNSGNIAGDVLVDGGSDGDIYTVFLDNLLSENVSLQDTGFSGDDILNAQATEGVDNITLTEFDVSTIDQTIQINEFFESIVINTLGGNDNIVMMNAPSDSVVLNAGDGSDNITVTGTVGVSDLDVRGGAGTDFIRINESSVFTTTDVEGGDGSDTFFVDSNVLGDITLSGGTASDFYNIGLATFGDRQVVINDADSDPVLHTLSVTGTSAAETLFISNMILSSNTGSIAYGDGLFDTVSVAGFGGDDAIHVIESNFALSLFGGNGNDIFNLASDAPSFSGNVDGITGTINIDGGEGLNRLNIANETGTPGTVTVAADAITGLTTSPISYTGRFYRADGEIGGIHILGSDAGGDVFDLVSLKAGDSIRIDGLGGDDVFNIGNALAGDAQFDGGEGSDIYNFQFGSDVTREIVIEDLGMTGTDVLNLTGSNSHDNIVISTDSISDAFTDLVFNIPLEEISIAGLRGNDTFTIDGAALGSVSLEGNEGADTFIVNGTTGINDLDLLGGDGFDNFVFNGSSGSTRIDAFGSLGNDMFRVEPGAIGNLFLDGEEGSDTYNVILGAAAARRINTRDSGTTGNDRTIVTGTSGDDRIAIRTTRFLSNDEIIVFDENTEVVTANSADGADRIVVFGSRSPLTEVFAGAGNDIFVVNGGSRAEVINLQGQDGDDTFNVFKTSADTTNNLFGNGGNDRFNIGSSVNADNGNLGLIRGALNIFGGSNDAGEEDRLVANDNAAAAAYSYRVSPNRISPIAGPAGLPRANFAGINYDASTELVRLDGTQFANLFQVVASPSTRYFIDGKSPTGNSGDRLTVVFEQNDGRKLTMTDQTAGDGFVSFTNGNENIQFQDIESPGLGTAGGSAGLPLDSFFSTADMDDLDDVMDV